MQSRSEQQWHALWQRIGAKGDPQRVYDDLVARYSEPHRAYHTIQHLRHGLDTFELVWPLSICHNVVELAIWYHDAVYNTEAKDNEKRSAALAVEMVKKASLPDSFGQLVYNLIMATDPSAGVPNDPDARFIRDIDLSILGQPKKIFDEYDGQIRKEYEWVPEDVFFAERSKILDSFLRHPPIYLTQFFRDKYEPQARRNLARSLARMQ